MKGMDRDARGNASLALCAAQTRERPDERHGPQAKALGIVATLQQADDTAIAWRGRYLDDLARHPVNVTRFEQETP